VREPLSGEPARDRRSPAEPLDQRQSSLGLRRQLGQRGTDCLRDEPVLPQVGADRRVSKAASGKSVRAGQGEAVVIDVADALERLERIGPRVLIDAGPGEPAVDLPP